MASSKTDVVDDEEEANRVNLFLHAENVRVFDAHLLADRILPVTLVTGFLGAGKTTLLEHILTNKSNLRIAAAINDFAELNIDENLIRHHSKGNTRNDTKLVELSNGCVCCHLLDDLQAAVYKMLETGGDVDIDAVNYLVIETSGVSDPLRIIRTLDAKFGKCFRARLDSVVTVVDADQMLMLSSYCDDDNSSNGSSPSDDENNAPGNIQRMSQAARAQLECADVVICNKMDLLQEDPAQDGSAVEQLIRSVNQNAVIHKTNHCKIPLSAILDVTIPSSHAGGAEDGGAVPITHEKSAVPIYVSATGGALRCDSSLVLSNKSSSAPRTSSTASSISSHLEADDFVSLSVSIADAPLSLTKLCQFVTSPMVIDRLARIKGVLWIQGGGKQQQHGLLRPFRCVVHLSGRGRLGFSLDGTWTGPPVSEMAFIGQQSSSSSSSNLVLAKEQLQDAFCNCSSLAPCEEGSDFQLDWKRALESLSSSPEFDTIDWDDSIGVSTYHVADTDECFNKEESNGDNQEDAHVGSLQLFRLTGSEVYGYSVEEMERDLRIDIDAMNMDLADAVNASIDRPKAFISYTKVRIQQRKHSDRHSSSPGNDTAAAVTPQERVVLCYEAGMKEPANNLKVLLREARVVLQTHFRNVQVCKCGA